MTQAVRVDDASQIADARRAAVTCATSLRLSETSVGRAALVATELATNLIKHAGGGSLLFGADEAREKSMVVVSLDKGRGLTNAAAALSDGYSTAGTAGTGLGAVRRASATFDVYALPDRGTTILATIEDAPRQTPLLRAPSRILVGGICIPKPGEEESGDAWTAGLSRDVVTVSVADGLGHGPAAATASTAAVRVVAERFEQPLEHMFQDAHGVLRPTRGAAMAVARLHLTAGRTEFIGVGNIAGTIVTDDAMRKTVSLSGIVGHEMRKVQSFSYPWLASSVLVLQSDGVSANWDATKYPGLMQHGPALIAAVLYRDHCRGTDDATVVVAKAS
ncbi:MAG: SpoIIE family protein phosphatase [Thermoanaerobaculia bacterium]